MPLIIMVGLPCTGKTLRAKQIKDILESTFAKKVHLVSDHNILSSTDETKNYIYLNFRREIELRGILKSEAIRHLQDNHVVILDAPNHIKGYRYELYSAAKAISTTHLVVECLASKESAWSWNLTRIDAEQYSKDVFDMLHANYEAPDGRNRWDSPLISLQETDQVDGKQIHDVVFLRKPPPPNQSTQSAPVVSSNFLFELDKTTQGIVNKILSAQKLNPSLIKLPELGSDVVLEVPTNVTLTPPLLAKYRRQFLNYSKLHPPPNDVKTIGVFFVKFLSSSLSS